MRYLIATAAPVIGVYSITTDPLLTVATAICAWITASILAITELMK